MSPRRLAFFLLCAACAQRVPDLDRTQPNKLQKSVFEGEWYYRQTVTDVPYGAGFSFIGETGRMERVRFEVSESYLTAYRAYEYVRDAEKPYVTPGTTYQGAPVAQFKISSHFDVQRQYNAATGEQTNVLEENTNDRPWNERKYFRVDWSNNLLSNFDFIAAGVSQSATPYYVNEPSDPDHWFLSRKDPATGEWLDVRDDRTAATLASADYFDLVSKIFAKPEEVDYYGDGSSLVPSCYVYGTSDCAPAEVKVRHSFMKVPAKSAYEPMDYPDNYPLRDGDGALVPDARGNIVRIPMFDKFGFFRTERDRFDQDRGLTETGRVYLINRWNLWKASKFDDGLDIPFNQRQIAPIVYYTSPNFPAQLKGAAQRMAQDWNKPFAETVAQLKNERTPSATVFELRDNTYSVGSDGRISNYGQRIGDLRYSMLYWVDQPLSAAPLGYGPTSSDPLSGEIINGNAYIYGASMLTYTQYAKDIVDLLNGELDPAEFQFGEASAKQVSARVQRTSSAAVRSLADLGAQMRRGQLSERLQTIKAIGKNDLLKDPSQVTGRLRAIEARPDLVSKLLSSEVLYALRKDGKNTASPSAEELKKFAPASWLSRDGFKREQERIDRLSRNCVYMAEFADDAVVGLARELKDKRPADISAAILESVFFGIAEHEMGHTFGLRHNFEGSYDALNFPRTYWDLKGSDAAPLDAALSDAQKNGKMRELQYSTVMDYGARFNSDVHGIGRYDHAAIRFGYGQLVDVFAKGPVRNAFNQRSLLLPLDPDFMRHSINYTSIPRFFGGVDVIDGRTVVPYAKIKQQHVSGQGTLTEVPYLFCSDEYAGGTPTCDRWDQGADVHEIALNAVDSYERYYFFNSFKRDRRYFSPEAYMQRIYSRYLGPLQTLYQHWVLRQFNDAPTWQQLGEMQECFNGSANPGVDCARFGGASFWQQISSLLGVSAGEGQLKLVNDADWNLDPDGGAPFAAATMEGLNALFRILETPEPGSYVDLNDFKTSCDPSDTMCADRLPFSNDYRADNRLSLASSDWGMSACSNQQKSINAVSGAVTCAKASVDTSIGRYPYTNYDGASGYYYFEKIAWIGSFYDKVAAVLTLTDPTTSFIGVDAVSDIRRFAIGWNLMFPNLMYRFFSAVAADNLQDYAPRVQDGARYERLPFAEGGSLDDLALGKLPPAIGADEAAGVPMDSANNFTVRLYALYYGMANFTSTFSTSFTDGAQICARGNGECPMPDTAPCDEIGGAQTAAVCWQMTSPTNHKVYATLKSPAAAGAGAPLGFKGIGEMLLEKAGAYARAYTAAGADASSLWASATAADRKKLQDRLDFTASTLQNAVEDIELVRGFYSLFGYIK